MGPAVVALRALHAVVQGPEACVASAVGALPGLHLPPAGGCIASSCGCW